VRGFGTTRFLSSDTPRNGQPSAVAADVVDLMDALGIDRAILAGFDWGKLPLPPPAEYQWWYQFYFATERGRAGYERHLHDFAKLIWRLTGELSRRSGPMQFIPSTWAAYGLGGDVHDPDDAVLGAANYLGASGAPGDYRVALYHYNPVPEYVDAVMRYARQMSRDPRTFYAYYDWQVFVLTKQGELRLTGPGL
jgi:pimeloyl-ACP methyl ester carboxylesterase